MMRRRRLVPTVMLMSLQAGAILCATASARDAPRRYDFAFEPRSRALQATVANATRLTAAVDLLARHGQRRELRFRIVGALPESCVRTLDCDRAQLLRQRLQTLVLALQEKWPAGQRPGVQELLTWGGLPSASAVADPDQLVILLMVRPVEPARACAQRGEVRDPALPGTIERPGTAEWIPIGGGRPTPVSASAMLRIVDTVRHTTELHDLPASGDVFRIPLPSRTEERRSVARPGGDDVRGVGDMLRPWGGSGRSASEPTRDECTLVFERWRVEAPR
jgi:hypothetical protein